MNRDDVIDKVKRLLALGASDNVHESALALETAQRLMAKHGLTQEQVEVGSIVESDVRSIATASRTKAWELRLARGIADAFGVGLLWRRGPHYARGSEAFGTYIFVGPEAEAKLAQYAAAVLLRQLSRARAKFTDGLPEYMGRFEKSGEVDAYCTGWVHAALSKVSRLDPHPSRRKAIEAYVETNSTKRSVTVNRSRVGSLASASMGSRDGGQAELNRPVNGGAQRKALGDGT